MKEQIGILVEVIPGDLPNKETVLVEVPVTLKTLDVTIADCVGTQTKVMVDIDADQGGC